MDKKTKKWWASVVEWTASLSAVERKALVKLVAYVEKEHTKMVKATGKAPRR